MAKKHRTKGKRGEAIARQLLGDRDWIILANTADGTEVADIIAKKDFVGTYCIEVKNTRIIDHQKARAQARKNAEKLKLPWGIMMKIESTSSWLVQFQGQAPTVWHEKERKKI